MCVQSAGLPADAAVTTHPGPESAYFSLFHSQPSMDNRAVRLSGVLSFFVAVLCAVFAERYVTEWVVSHIHTLVLLMSFSASLGGH